MSRGEKTGPKTQGHISRQPSSNASQRIPECKSSFNGDSHGDSYLEIAVKGVINDASLPNPVEKLEDNILYYPTSKNSPAIVVLIRDKKMCYGLKATIEAEHDVKEGLQDMLAGPGLLSSSSEYEYVHILVRDCGDDLSAPCTGVWKSTGGGENVCNNLYF